MQLHKNHHFSIGKGSEHANARYFFVVDKMEKKDVKMVHCPTENMTADYSTKTTQGTIFAHQRKLTLGIKDEDFINIRNDIRSF